jgi:hypothetical protein
MLLRDTIIEPKFIEKARLITDLPTHHRRAPASFRLRLRPFTGRQSWCGAPILR